MAQNTINIQVGANTSSFTSSVNRAFSKVPSGINVPINLPLGKVSSDLKQFERSLDAATARVISFTATTRILYSLGNAIKRLTSDSIKVEDAMARISSILKSTGAETDKLKNSLFSLANSTSTAFYEVADAAEEFSRQGLSVAKTLEATNSALLISKLSGSNLKTTIEGVTAVMSTFNNESLGFVDVANKLSALDARFATSSAGLIEGLKRVGGVASDAGVSLDQTAAAITVLKQVTGRSESVLGNALKSIFVSLQSDKVQKDLKQIGVEVTDTTGEFRNLTDVITDLSKAFESLSDSQRSSITQKVAGKYQANAFSGLITAFKSGGKGQSSLFDKAVSISRDSENEATDRLKILNKTTASELTRLSNTVTKFGAEIGDKVTKPLISNLANSLTVGLETMKSSTDQFTNGLNVLLTGKLDDSGKSLGDAIIAGIGNALGGPGLALLGYALLKFTTRILKDSVGAVKSILDIKSAQDQVTLSTQQTAQFMPKLEEADLARIGRLTTIAAREAEILAILNQQYATYQLMQSGTAAATALFSNPGVSVKGSRVVKGKASGHMPEEIDAIYREAMDIRDGVGGATPLARPIVKTLNVGNGPERVVINSDEKIIKNFAGSGEDAVINREMMGYARGNIPSFAIGKVYRGFDKSLEGGISRGAGSKIQKKFGYDGADKLKNLLRSKDASDFFTNGPIEAYSYSNIPGATISTSSSATAALRFAPRWYGEGGGLAEAGVRIVRPGAIERLSDRFNRKKIYNEKFGTYLYRLASKKPFGVSITDIEKLRGGLNSYPVEREINLLDPKGRVFSRENKLGFRNSYLDNNEPLANIRSRLYTDTHKKYEEFLTKGHSYDNGYILPKSSTLKNVRKRSSKIENLILRTAFGQGTNISKSKRFTQETDQISRGYIPNFATGSGPPKMPRTIRRRQYIPPQRPSAKLYNNGSQIFPPPPSNGINPQTQALVDQLNANKGSSILSRAGAKYNDFSQAGRRYSGLLGTSAFAIPFLGGAVGEKVGGASGRVISSASQSFGTAALIGSINPLAGVAVGVGAAFNTLAEAGKEFSVDMDGLKDKLSKTSEEVKNNQNAFSNYATTFATFKDATSTGSAKDIANLSKQLGFFLSDIKDTGLRDKIKSTNDLADLQQLGFEQSIKDKAKLSDSELSAAVGKAAQDRQDPLDSISKFFTQEKVSLGRELLTSEASLSKDFAQKAIKSLDVSKLSEETKFKILAGKRATYSDINNAVDPNTLLSSALSEGGSSLFNSSGFAGDLTQEIKKQLEAASFSKEKVGSLVEIKPLRDLIDLSVKNIQTNFISKQEKVSSSLDILSNKIDLAGNSFGEVTKATLDYNVKLAETRSKFRGSNNELNSSFLDSARSIIKEQNLTPENTSRALDATNALVANGDFKGFIAELSDVFGKGFPTELEKILSDNLVERRKLSIQEVNTMNALKVNFKNSIDKLRAQQASKLYSNLDPNSFRENLDQYTSNLGLATSPRVINKNIRSSFDINGNSFFDKDLNRRYSRRNVQVLDQNALRGQAIIDKVRAEESLGLRGIDLSPNADKRLLDAKKQEVEFARNQVRQATLDKLSQFQARSVGESAPIFFNSINSQYKKNLGTTTPLLTKDFQSEFQDKVAVSDFQGAYDSLQRQRLIAESSARGRVPLKDIKGADDIRAVFTELENLLKNTIQNSKLNTLIANETAKNEVRDKSVPAEMLSELRSINKLIGNSNKSLVGIESMFLAQTYSGKTNVLLGQRANSLSGIEAMDKSIEKIKYDNRPYELVQKEREGITNRGASLAAELNDSIEKYNNSKDTNERNRQARRADTISSKIDENNRKLSEFQKRDSERKRYFDGGEGKISNLRDQRDSIINSANSKLGEELNNSIAPLLKEFIPLIKSLDDVTKTVGSVSESFNSALEMKIYIEGLAKAFNAKEFAADLNRFIEQSVTKIIKTGTNIVPKIIPLLK